MHVIDAHRSARVACVPHAKCTRIRNLILFPSLSHPKQYPTCIELISSGRVNLGPMITHRFGFSKEEVLQGFETASRPNETHAIKVMFNL